MPSLIIRRVEKPHDFRSREMKDFFEFPWKVYKNDPNWVPPLLSQRRKLLDKHKNPSWEYMEGEYYVAYRADKPVGCIAAFINKRHNEYWEEQIGWFGFFEVFDDQEAATALLQTASDYVKSKGMNAIRGPANFTTNDECAMLIEGFERPAILMPYNMPYYQRLVENSGLNFAKVMDLESWYMNPELFAGKNLDEPPEKLIRVVQKAQKAKGIVVRRPDAKRLKEELKLLREVYEAAWEKNWGFVPPTDHEMDHLFADLKDYLDPEIGRFALIKGETVSFMFGLPDMNQVLHRAYPRPGEPEIWTLLKALWHWKVRRVITGLRILLFGVKPNYRGIGVDAAVSLDMFQGLVHKYWDVDCGWFLETNQPMIQFAKSMRMKLYRRYRFYQRPLA
jgi:hypothetical protein